MEQAVPECVVANAPGLDGEKAGVLLLDFLPLCGGVGCRRHSAEY